MKGKVYLYPQGCARLERTGDDLFAMRIHTSAMSSICN
jgi:hypothetical protein